MYIFPDIGPVWADNLDMTDILNEGNLLPSIDTIQINSGEYIGMSIIEILSIPHISILSDDISTETRNKVIERAASEMSNLFTEI